MRNVSPSHRNHTGELWAWPSARTVVSQTTRSDSRRRWARALAGLDGSGTGPPGSEQRGPDPVLAEQVLVEEGQHRLVPDPDMRWGEDPVVLVGEVEKLGLDPAAGQVGPEPQGLADRHPVVALAVDDQHGRADPGQVAVGGVVPVALGHGLGGAE